MHPGQRVLDRTQLEARVQVELGALEAHWVEIERAGAFSAIFDRTRQIADPLPIRADGNHINDVRHLVIMEIEASLAPAPEVVGKFRLCLPALRRDQLGIAGILAILAEHWLSEEIEEINLPDAAAKFQADVPILGWAPGQGHAALGPKKLACRLIIVDPIEL